MIFPQPFPAGVPKFGFAVLFVQKKEIFDPNLQLKIFLPGDPNEQPSIEADLSPADGSPPPQSPDPEPTLVTMRATFVVSPLVIKQEGRIRVRVLRQGAMHRVGALYVRSSATLATTSLNTALPPA